MTKKAMLSQPMAGKTKEEIVATRERAIRVLESRGYEVVNTLFTDEWYSEEAMESRGVVQIPLCFLAKSLENMSLCHAAYFCRGWENARGCRIEHEAAKAYGLEIIYEDDAEKTNADHIRGMTDEKLAELFAGMCQSNADGESRCYACLFNAWCPACGYTDDWLEWLQQPYK